MMKVLLESFFFNTCLFVDWKVPMWGDIGQKKKQSNRHTDDQIDIRWRVTIKKGSSMVWLINVSKRWRVGVRDNKRTESYVGNAMTCEIKRLYQKKNRSKFDL